MSKKLELKEILAAIDLGAIDAWDEFTDEERKSVAFFLLNRYVSNVRSNNKDIVEHYVILTNELFNKNFYKLSKHPKLLWQLLCACSHESKKIHQHEWLGLKRANDPSNKKVKLLMELYPTAKIQDIEVLASMIDNKQAKQIVKDHGWTDKQINELKL